MTTLRSLLVCSAIFVSAVGFAADEGQPGSADKDAAASTAEIRRKLNRIVIPKLEFHDATLREAVDFLKKQSVVMDTESPAGDRGVNIVFKLEESGGTALESAPQAAPPASVGNPAEARITVSLANIPLIEALKYVTGLANLKFKVEPDAVSIVPLNAPTGSLITKEWKIPPDLIPHTAAAADTPKEGMEITDRETARNWLIANGVTFSGAASAIYIVKGFRLIVRNTEDQLDLIDTIINGSTENGPVLIDIECKLVEFRQEDLKELKFDSLFNQFHTPALKNVFVSGRNIGIAPITSDTIKELAFQFQAPNDDFCVLTDPQFQSVRRVFNQKKGVDLFSAPTVTVKSDQRAVIEVFREFRNSTEDTPPQIPQGPESLASAKLPASSSRPTHENRNFGVTIEVRPVVGPDGYTLDLDISQQIAEFEGAVGYGGAISSNPIFSTDKHTRSVSVYDGSTVMLGLLSEDVPERLRNSLLLGSVPIIGRLSPSSPDQRAKRNLVIFVTARLRNAGSEPVRANDEKEEVIETIASPAPPPLTPK